MANLDAASRESVGIASVWMVRPKAIVQVYATRASSRRGLFGVHTWVARKPTSALMFTIPEVVG